MIGTDVTGTAALGNQGDGVAAEESAGNTIGGTVAGAGNVIAANGGNGVVLFGFLTTQNVVAGNLIGTSADGTGNLGNGSYGVWVDGASQNQIGGQADGTANRIAFNGDDGVNVNFG